MGWNEQVSAVLVALMIVAACVVCLLIVWALWICLVEVMFGAARKVRRIRYRQSAVGLIRGWFRMRAHVKSIVDEAKRIDGNPP